MFQTVDERNYRYIAVT